MTNDNSEAGHSTFVIGMSFIDFAALPYMAVKYIGIPGSLLVFARYVLKSPLLIAIVESRKATGLAKTEADAARHISDNEIRIAEINAKSARKIARYKRSASSENASLRIDRK